MTGKRNASVLLRMIEAYGASPRRWPAEAETLPFGEAEKDALRRAAALDDRLDGDRTKDRLPPALRARILAAAPVRGAARPLLPFAMPAPWMRAAGVAAALATGMAAGYAGAAAAFPAPAPEQTLLGLALTAPDNPFAAYMEEDL